MKQVITLFLVAALACGSATLVKAQRLVFIYGHGQYNLPVSDNMSNAYQYGLGAQAGVGVGLGSSFFVGTLGYQNFKGNNGIPNLQLTTAKLGIRKTMLLKRVFVQLNGGYGNLKAKGASSTDGVFVGDIVIGAKLAGIELSGSYEGFSQNGWNSWFGLKAGFHFGL